MRWKFWERAPGNRLGLMLAPLQAAWVSTCTTGTTPQITGNGIIHQPQGPDQLQALKTLITEAGLGGHDCHLTLSGGHYQFFLTESPNVPDDELNDAVRWRIADMLTFPAAEAVIDAFRLPDDAYRGRQKMIYVGVIQQRVLDEVLDQVKGLGLQPAGITIPEMALLTLARRVLESDESCAVVSLNAWDGNLLLLQAKNLYLARQAPIGWEQLSNPTEFDSLLLEIQRSMDFYDSQIGKGAIRKIWLLPGPHAEPLLNFLRENLTPAVDLLPTDGLFSDDTVSLPECLPAVGATLRGLP